MYWEDMLFGEDMFLAVFFLLVSSVFWIIIITNFFHCLLVDGEKLYMAINLKFNMAKKKYNLVYSLSIMVFRFKWN